MKTKFYLSNFLLVNPNPRSSNVAAAAPSPRHQDSFGRLLNLKKVKAQSQLSKKTCITCRVGIAVEPETLTSLTGTSTSVFQNYTGEKSAKHLFQDQCSIWFWIRIQQNNLDLGQSVSTTLIKRWKSLNNTSSTQTRQARLYQYVSSKVR